MKNLFCLFLLVALIACQNQPATVYVDVPLIPASRIYEADTLKSFIAAYHPENDRIAEQYEKKARKQEKRDLEKAIYLCKRSITLKPTLQRYLYLSSLLEKDGRFNERSDLLRMLVNEPFVFGEPDQDLYYEFLANEVISEGKLYQYYVYVANENFGFDIKALQKRLLSDKRIKLDPASVAYKNIELQFMSPEEIEEMKKDPRVFLEMLRSIKDTAGTFQIGVNESHSFTYDREESWEPGDIELSALFDKFLYEKIEQPDKWFRYHFDRKIKLGDSVYAVLYSIDSSQTACPKEMRHIYRRLVTYGPDGTIRDQQLVAWQGGEELATLHFSRNAFSVTRHKRNWKKTYKYDDFDNFITGIEELGSTHYSITPGGDIIELKPQSEAVSDSTLSEPPQAAN